MMRPILASIADAEHHFERLVMPLPFLTAENKRKWAETTVAVMIARKEVVIDPQLRLPG